MVRIIKVETNENFETCDKCVYENDSGVSCKIRGCIHAIMENDIKDHYKPKDSEE